MIPQEPGTPGEAAEITDDFVGVMTNGVLLDSHSQTWAYDMCNGHSDKKHHYHYHIPPICYLKSLGVPAPTSDKWWINDAGTEVRAYGDMYKQFPSTGTSPVVGFARDGFPIYALYGPEADSPLVRSALYGGDLDECNGKGEGADYAYYITAEPPFVPTCLKGTVGTLSFVTSDKKCPAGGIKNTISGVKTYAAGPIPADSEPAGGGDSDGDDGDSDPPAPAPAPGSPAFAKVPFFGALASVALAIAVLV